MTWTKAGLWFCFPEIDWDLPLPVTFAEPQKKTWTCRICIANHGFHKDSAHQWATEDAARQHMETEHGQQI